MTTIDAHVITDSLSPAGARLVTLQLKYPRFVHAQFMTHRVFSRNASSSRAIPVRRMIETVREDPVYPVDWGRNQPGMQAGEAVSAETAAAAQAAWDDLLQAALATAERLADMKVHKQVVNRVLEPFAHISVICTATEWDNFFALRLHEAAQPEIQALARAIHDAMAASTPTPRPRGAWHLPYVDDAAGLSAEDARLVSVARCARVSYLRHDGTAPDLADDLALARRRLADRHMSPFEQQATPLAEATTPAANFRGWSPYRALVEAEQGS